jgi:putative ABC transport system substrate-binding protein
MSFGPIYRDYFKAAATLADKILRGARPGELPIEQPARFEMVINAKTARALGLTLPATMLARADEVIE